MRYVLAGMLLLSAVIWWGRPKAGPPEAVVGEFLRAAQRENWGRAQSDMTQHVRGRLSMEGIGGMERYVQSRLEPFLSFEIVRTIPRGDEADVLVRLLLPAPKGTPAEQTPPGSHRYPGRIEGDQFVHAHRFQLQREGRAWRIYQFEEVDERPRP